MPGTEDGVPVNKLHLISFGASIGKIHGEDEIVWSQYTGLKDKHGKEVYEGDIVRMDKGGEPYRVQYQLYHSQFSFVSQSGNINLSVGVHFTEATIIGNIYENPELLN